MAGTRIKWINPFAQGNRRAARVFGPHPGSPNERCAQAFRDQNKSEAQRLLSEVRQPAIIRVNAGNIFALLTLRIAHAFLIHLAASNGWVDVFADLVTKFHCDKDWTDDEQHTALHYATFKGQLDMTTYLITQLKSDPNSRNNYGDSPLHYACISGNLQLVRYLIVQVRCDPNITNNDGNTPLHIACSYRHMQVAKCLITEFGCDPLAKNKYGDSALHMACGGGTTSSIGYEKLLLMNFQVQNSNNPIAGSKDIVNYLVTERGINPELENYNGDTPLHCACFNNDSRIVRYLLFNKKVKPFKNNKDGRNAWFYVSIVHTHHNEILNAFQQHYGKLSCIYYCM